MQPSARRVLAMLSPLILAATVLHAPLPPTTTAAHAKKEKSPPLAPDMFMTAAPIATGSIGRFLVNPHGEVDALLLADGTFAKFPPHMGREVTAVLKAGDTVSVRGHRQWGGAVKAFVITNETTKQQVVDRPPAPDFARMPKHLRYATLTRLTAVGRIERALLGKRGEVKGVLLNDGTVVRFPRHAAYQFGALLRAGQSIAVEGLGTENQYGRGLEATAIGAGVGALEPIYR